jgi:hypothetical protein
MRYLFRLDIYIPCLNSCSNVSRQKSLPDQRKLIFQFKGSTLKSAYQGTIRIAIKVLDARRRGVTTEAYETIRRKPFESLKV